MLQEVSILKTVRFNVRYFGLRGLRLPVFVARNYMLGELGGEVILNNFSTGVVKLGFSGVGIFDKRYDRGIWECFGTVRFLGTAYLGQGSKVSVGRSATLSIGNSFNLTAKSEIVCHQQVSFGDNVLISWDSLLMDTDFHHIEGSQDCMPIIVGNHVWIGCHCIILKGAVIPSGSVVAAGATITKPLDSCALYGDTNKKLRDSIVWHAK